MNEESGTVLQLQSNSGPGRNQRERCAKTPGHYRDGVFEPDLPVSESWLLLLSGSACQEMVHSRNHFARCLSDFKGLTRARFRPSGRKKSRATERMSVGVMARKRFLISPG